jgi:hypothetical protein
VVNDLALGPGFFIFFQEDGVSDGGGGAGGGRGGRILSELPPLKKLKEKAVRGKVKKAVRELAAQETATFDDEKLDLVTTKLLKLIKLEHDLASILRMAKVASQIARDKAVPYDNIEVMHSTNEDFIPIAKELIRDESNDPTSKDKEREAMNMILLLTSGL